MRRPPVVLGMALITALALCVALGLILFSVNPGVDRNERELKQAVMSQHAIICAQVQNTANAYRFRSLTPSGEVEPIRHFLTRMQAQAQTLRLARGAECKSAPGFPPVGLQVRRALEQIHRILMSFEPRLREPISREQTSHDPPRTHKQGGFLRGVSRPPHAGIDESGVPAKVAPELAPSAPLSPESTRKHQPPPPESAEPSKATPLAPEPSDSNGPDANLVVVPPPAKPPAGPPLAEAKLEAPKAKIELEIP